jgi:hypothetical protein
MVPLFLVINGLIILGPGFTTRSFSLTVVGAVIYVIGFMGFMAVMLLLFGLAMAFLLKQRGVVGQHVLEITEQGLIERTEFNENLHKWASICRIVSIFGHLYIYVGDMNSYQVPKRCFSPLEIAEFEADLRAHAEQVNPR